MVTIQDDTTGSTSQLDPSSEAEALSHVASGIAASLGLAAPADSPGTPATSTTEQIGPLSDLETFDESIQRNPAKRTRASLNSSTENSPRPSKVIKLASEWDEEEEKS